MGNHSKPIFTRRRKRSSTAKKVGAVLAIAAVVIAAAVLVLLKPSSFLHASTRSVPKVTATSVSKAHGHLYGDIDVIASGLQYVQSKEARTNNGHKGLPILMYHLFYDPAVTPKPANDNIMDINDFAQQMEYLHDNHYYYPTWDEVAAFVEHRAPLPEKSVVVTIDDGDPSFFSLAVPVLKKYNVRATPFVITSRTGTAALAPYRSPLLDFESHSHDMHRGGRDGKGRFLTMTHDEAQSDLTTTSQILGSHEAFCYPFGDYSTFAEDMLKEAGYKVAVTTKGGRALPGMDPLALPRVRMSASTTLREFISRVE